MTDRRFSDLDNPADEIQRSDWIVGLLSALVLAIVLYAAVFGLGRSDQTAASNPALGAFSMAQITSSGPIPTAKDNAR